jgi:hypothetical protein
MVPIGLPLEYQLSTQKTISMRFKLYSDTKDRGTFPKVELKTTFAAYEDGLFVKLHRRAFKGDLEKNPIKYYFLYKFSP